MAFMEAERALLATRANGEIPEHWELLCRADNEFAVSLIHGVYCQDQMIGFALRPSWSPEMLSRLYVSEAYRRQGVGKYMVHRLDFTCLSCLKSNTAALAFYQSLGFRVVRDQPHTVLLERF